MLEQLKDLLSKEEENSNWLDTGKANEILEKVRKQYPGIAITINDEHFIITKDDGKSIYIPRWKKIPTSEDNKKIDGHIGIIDAIKKAIEDVIEGE